MRRNQTPNFRGLRALILHPEGRTTAALRSQLEKLDMEVVVDWPQNGTTVTDTDVVFFDADRSHPALLPWKPGEAPIPLVALAGSETPGRLQWALDQTPSAFIQKPIGSRGVYGTLIVAFHFFEREREQAATIRDLTERVQARQLVVRAVLQIMTERGVDDTAAFDFLRQRAMDRQIPIEEQARDAVVADAARFEQPDTPRVGKSKAAGES